MEELDRPIMSDESVDDLVRMACSSAKKEKYYRAAFGKIDAGKNITWNWAALIGGGAWMLYHKMYKEVAILIGVTTLIGTCELMLCGTPHMVAFLVDVIVVLIGMFGNKLLLRSLGSKREKGYCLNQQFKAIDDRFIIVCGVCCVTIIAVMMVSLTTTLPVDHVYTVIAAVFVLRVIAIAVRDLRGAKRHTNHKDGV